MSVDHPQTLARADIAARLPHQGRMCLLDRVESWAALHIHCSATNHHDADHPLRSASGLLAPTAIEYAAQAMAVHAALTADDAAPPRPGYIASVRNVRLLAPRLDLAPGALHIRAQRLAADGKVAAYQFSVSAADGALLVEGRVTVVLNTPLIAPA